jgi:hypothetical protein
VILDSLLGKEFDDDEVRHARFLFSSEPRSSIIIFLGLDGGAAPVWEGHMDERLTTLSLQIEVGPDADASEVSDATTQLRRELLDLDVEKVDLVPGEEAPPGSRGVELAALGALAVSFARSQLLRPMIAAIQSWLSRSQQRSIKLEIAGDILELTGVSSAEQRRLTDEWLKRHAVS